MENFLLGVFSEELSKYIVGFRKEQVNANLLNGKGEIKDVELNVSVLNTLLSTYGVPYIEFESIHVNKLSFNVTSFTNLKKAPIVIHIDEITASIVEPLHFDSDSPGGAPSIVLQPDDVDGSGGGSNKRGDGVGGKGGPKSGRSGDESGGSSSGHAYGLFDRIGDNVHVEVNKIRLTFQPLGKFKTRRFGPWTPPSFSVTLSNVRYVSVDEYGEENTPDAVWRHNSRRGQRGGGGGGGGSGGGGRGRGERRQQQQQQTSPSSPRRGGGRGGHQHHRHHHHRAFLIYKRLTMECTVGLDGANVAVVAPPRSQQPPQPPPSTLTPEQQMQRCTLVKNAEVVVHVAFHKRLRDTGLLGVQVDASLESIEINLEPHAVPLVAHAAAGVHHCMYKDRPFDDPLVSIDEEEEKKTKVRDSKEQEELERRLDQRRRQQQREDEMMKSSEGLEVSLSMTEEGGPLAPTREDVGGVLANMPFQPELSDDDDESTSSSSSSGGNDDQSYQGGHGQGTGPLVPDAMAAEAQSDLINSGDDQTSPPTEPSEAAVAAPTKAGISRYKGPRKRAVLVLASGIKIYEQLSLSLSIESCTMRAKYNPNNEGDYLQLALKGFVSELIWPTANGDRGGYVQLSLSYISLQERGEKVIHNLVLGGTQYGVGVGHGGAEEEEEEELARFPIFETRSIRDDPLGLRNSFPAHAIGLKATVTFLDETSNDWSKTMVLNELGLDRMEIVLDSDPWCRAIRFLMNEKDGGFDPRWYSGDWSTELSAEMLCSSTPDTFVLGNYLQPLPELFLDKNHMISSELFNVAARISNLQMRIPAPVHIDIRSSDVVVSLPEAKLKVSNMLPRCFLTGRVCGCSDEMGQDGGKSAEKIDFDFPNDPSDLCYALSSTEGDISDEGKKSSFRAQLAVKDFEVRVNPVVPFFDAVEPQLLVGPTSLTCIAVFEGHLPATSGNDSINVAFFVSALIHHLSLNVDFDVIMSAAGTLAHHSQLSIKSLASLVSQKGPSPSEKNQANGITGTKRRHVLKQQVARSKAGGRFSLVLCIHVPHLEVCLWRQHVPLKGQSRGSKALLLLSKLVLKQVEFGVEVREGSQQNSASCGDKQLGALRERRLVVKMCLLSVVMHIVDFNTICSAEELATKGDSGKNLSSETEGRQSASDADTPDGNYMIELFAIEETKVQGVVKEKNNLSSHEKQGLSFRLEKCQSSLSFAAEVVSEAILHVEIAPTEAVTRLLIEALLMPAGACSLTLFAQNASAGTPDKGMQQTQYPSGSIGAVMELAAKKLVCPSKEVTDNEQNFVENSVRSTQPEMARACPPNIQYGLNLSRLYIGSLLVVIPDCTPKTNGEDTASRFGLILKAEFASALFGDSMEPQAIDKVMKKLSGAGVRDWNMVGFRDTEPGFHCLVRSTQSLYHFEGVVGGKKELIPAFGMDWYYHPKNVHAALGERCTLSFSDIGIWRRFHLSMLECGAKGASFAASIPFVLASRKNADGQRNIQSNGINSEHVTAHGASQGDEFTHDRSGPLSRACGEVSSSLQAARSLLKTMEHAITSYDLDVQSTASKGKKELEVMRSLVFLKERERVGAVALVQSQACGWIRMGILGAQRVMSTTTLRRCWAMLRKSLIIIFRKPGISHILEIISLEGAHLRSLEGGRNKRDLERGFALVDTSGQQRVFVLASNSEYITWVKEISRYTRAASETVEAPNEPEDESEATVPLVRENGTESNDSFVQSDAAALIATEMSKDSADDSANVPGTEEEESRVHEAASLSVPTEEERHAQAEHSEDDSTDFCEVPLAPGSESNEMPSTAEGEKNDYPHGASKMQTNREEGPAVVGPQQGGGHQMIRQRFSKLGDTRSKLGAAMKSARENIRAAGEIHSPSRTQSRIESSHSESLPKKTNLDAQQTHVEPHQTPRRARFRQTISTMNVKAKAVVKNVVEHPAAHGAPALQFDSEERIVEEGGGNDQQRELSMAIKTTYEAHTIAFNEGGIPEDTTEQSFEASTGQNASQKQRRKQLFAMSKIGSAVKTAKLDERVSKIGALTTSAVRNVKIDKSALKQLSGGTFQHPNREARLTEYDVSEGGPRHSILSRMGKGNSMPDSLMKLKSIRVGAEAPALNDVENAPVTKKIEKLSCVSGKWAVSVKKVKTKDTTIAPCYEQLVGVLQDTHPSRSAGSHLQGSTYENTHSVVNVNNIINESRRGQDTRVTPEEDHDVWLYEISTLCGQRDMGNGAHCETKPVLKSLSDILVFHSRFSEAVAQIDVASEMQHQHPDGIQGEMERRHKTGVSMLEQVRITGMMLQGVLESHPAQDSEDCLREYHCEVIGEFLNSVLACPLPPIAREAVVKFLDLAEAINKSIEHAGLDDTASILDKSGNKRQHTVGEMAALSATVESELARAESRALLAQKLATSIDTPPSALRARTTVATDPFMRSLAADTASKAAMQKALMSVMAERDEAHAQLVAASVLHVHELEQERKKVNLLTKKLEAAEKLEQQGGTSFFMGQDEILRKDSVTKYEREMMNNTDQELLTMCRQLSSEISARTSATLEIVRLKESRKLERESENAERLVLLEEIRLIKEQLEAEKRRSEKAKLDAMRWRHSFDEMVSDRDNHPDDED